MTDLRPRLSETLRPIEFPHRCQRCGAYERLTTWQECDARDRPEVCHVVLCEPCADRVVKPHPRMYRRLAPNAPACGVMSICEGCQHRDGSRCRSPRAKANGGEGLQFPGGAAVHVQRTGPGGRGRRCGWEHWFEREPDLCEGFEPRSE